MLTEWPLTNKREKHRWFWDLHKYDIEYIENWNLYLDIKILFKTFGALKHKVLQNKNLWRENYI